MPLKGFLTSKDINTIVLDKNNIELQYKDSDVIGNEEYKDVIYRQRDALEGDTKHEEKIPEFDYSENGFFTLSGEGSENYEIYRDKTNKLPLRGKVLRRPVNVEFYNVFKVYDGTPFIPKERLCYRFTPTSSTSSGLVLGTLSDSSSLYLYKAKALSDENRGYNYIQRAEIPIELAAFGNLPVKFEKDEKLQDYESPELKLSVKISGGGDVISVDNATEESHKYIVEPIPYCYKAKSSTFLLEVLDTPIEYRNYRGVNKTPNVINKVKEFYPCKFVNSKGYGLHLQLTFQIKTVEDDSRKAIEEFIPSDFNKVTYRDSIIDAENKSIQFSTSEVTDELQPLNFINPKLAMGPLGDKSNCYEINNLTGFGIIAPRLIHYTLEFESKVYDGNSVFVPRNITYDNVVEGDLVEIDIKKTQFYAVSNKVGTHNLTDANSYENYLTGRDAHNYIIDCNNPTVNVTITQKPIHVSIEFIRFIISTGKFEIAYNLDGIISHDEVYLNLTDSIIEIESGKEVSSLFINTTQYDTTKFTYSIENGNEVPNIEITIDSNTKAAIRSEMNVNISDYTITGIDAGNYRIINNTCNDVPIYIVYGR